MLPYTSTKILETKEGLLEGEVNVVYADLHSGSSCFYFPSTMVVGLVFTVSLLKWIIKYLVLKEFHNGMLI